jgi:hypothetical protein
VRGIDDFQIHRRHLTAFLALIYAAFAHGFLGFPDLLPVARLIEGGVVLGVKPLLLNYAIEHGITHLGVSSLAGGEHC